MTQDLDVVIERVAVDTIKVDARNARRHPRENIEAIKRSLKKFGQVRPLLVDKEGVIRAGNGTFEAIQSLKLPTCLIIRSNLPIPQIKAYAIADNRTTDMSDFDNELLLPQLQEIEADIELLEATGYDEAEVRALEKELNREQRDAHEDDAPPPPTQPIARVGDMWTLGEHRIFCADSKKRENIEKLKADASWAAVITDPPYGISVVKGTKEPGKIGGDSPYGGKQGKIDGRKIVNSNWYAPVIGDDEPFDPGPFMKLAPIVVLCGANCFSDRLPPSRGWIVWDKIPGLEGTTRQFSQAELIYTNQNRPCLIYRQVWHGLIREGEHEPRVHPTQKPVRLFEFLMTEFTREGEIILDPFLGAGSTILAAERTRRTAYCLELSPHYVDVAVKRWETYTGKRATRIR